PRPDRVAGRVDLLLQRGPARGGALRAIRAVQLAGVRRLLAPDPRLPPVPGWVSASFRRRCRGRRAAGLRGLLAPGGRPSARKRRRPEPLLSDRGSPLPRTHPRSPARLVDAGKRRRRSGMGTRRGRRLLLEARPRRPAPERRSRAAVDRL